MCSEHIIYKILFNSNALIEMLINLRHVDLLQILWNEI